MLRRELRRELRLRLGLGLGLELELGQELELGLGLGLELELELGLWLRLGLEPGCLWWRLRCFLPRAPPFLLLFLWRDRSDCEEQDTHCASR